MRRFEGSARLGEACEGGEGSEEVERDMTAVLLFVDIDESNC